MFSLIYKNQIQLGPISWSKTRFTDELEELEIQHDPLPTVNELPIVIDADTKILPTVTTYPATFNETFEDLSGPVQTISNDLITLQYTHVDKPIDQVKSILKSKVAEQRWKYETSGTSITLQGITVNLPTTKGDRDIFLQAYQLGRTDINWKFGADWLTLTNLELGQIVTAIMTHVQSAFDWEGSKCTEIDGCVDIAGLKLVELKNPLWEVNPGVV